LKPKKRSFVAIFDLEFTAWEGSLQARWTRPGEHTEVVQIGAVKLDAADLKEVGSFEALVKPRINAVLSPYFIALTGITNERLNAVGVDFITAFRAFIDFVGDAQMWAFGRDDLIFEGNLERYAWTGIPMPPYVNAIPWFAANGVDLKGKHACDVAEAAGTAFVGRKHDALADARGVAAGFRHLIGKGAENPFLSEKTS
jgi:inhibitor of KinA sporulation pathway (predicted exonuclease)